MQLRDSCGWCRWLAFGSALLGAGLVCAQSDYDALLAQFKIIRTNTVWPVAGSSQDDIEETFGPRRQPSAGGAYDWHRGVDIDGGHGHDIVAALAGEFLKYTYSESGGWTVVLQHTFPAPVSYHGKTLRYFYTWYLHLDDSQTPAYIKEAQAGGTHPAIETGQLIARMGNSGQGPGDAYATHLHFELRIGTQSSLEFQRANFATNSPSFYGFDPHVHPLLLFPPLPNTLALTLLQEPRGDQDGIVLFTAGTDDQPTLNRVEVSILDSSTGQPLESHRLDLNQRFGFDATTNPALDTQDKTKPYFAPLYFTDAQTDYQTQIVIPKEFVAPLLTAGRNVRMVARDIWGNATQIPTPVLAATQPGATRILRWPATLGEFNLQSTGTLNPSAGWVTLTNQPTLTNGNFECHVETTSAQTFFRLLERSPIP